MAKVTAEAVRIAKRNVRRWFIETVTGPAFLPGNGAAILLPPGEAQAIRAAAVDSLALSYAEIRSRTVRHIVILVCVITAFSILGSQIPESLRSGVRWVSYGAYFGHGVKVLCDFWRWEQEMFEIRAAIGRSLSLRVPLPADLAGPAAMPEIDYRRWQTLAFILTGALLTYELVGPHAAVSPWVPAVLAAALAGVLFWITGFALIQDGARLLSGRRSRRW